MKSREFKKFDSRNGCDHRVALMSFVAVIMVVFIHTAQHPTKEMFSWWSMQIFGHGICKMAVPFFFIVSGYFLGKHFDEECWWRTQVLRRVKTILVPYFAWNLICFVYALGFALMINLKAGITWNSGLPVDSISLMRVLGVYPDFPFFVPTWYLRALFIFVLISPIFARKGLWVLALVGVVKVAFDAFGWGGGVLNVVNPTGLFYFGLGCYLSHHPIRIARHPRLGWACVAVAFFLAGLRAVIIHGEWMRGDLVGCVMVPIALIGFWMALPKKRVPEFIRNSTMVIYLSHTLIAALFFDVLRITWPLSVRPCGADMWFQTLGAQILLVGFQLIIALLFARLVSRSKLLNAILFGGRG